MFAKKVGEQATKVGRTTSKNRPKREREHYLRKPGHEHLGCFHGIAKLPELFVSFCFVEVHKSGGVP